MPDPVRFAIVAMGGIGLHHAKILSTLPGAKLAAFSSRDPARRAAAHALYPNAAAFATHSELIASRTADVILVANPHFEHIPVVREALRAGLHVLVEKPMCVTAAEARGIVAETQQYPNQLFGMMLNQRTHPVHQRIKAMIAAGELGKITRVSWNASHWYRPQSYYTAAPWRAAGPREGGGVLINQCHHNLDLLHWMIGLKPQRITAVGYVGKQHQISSEDEVSAILECDGGTIAHFFTSTGEGAGTNRLEIAGTRAKIVLEDGIFRLGRLQTDARDFLQSSPEPFSAPAVTWETLTLTPPPDPDHRGILEDFTCCVQAGKKSTALLAPAADSLPAMEISNAMLMAAITRRAVDLPVSTEGFEEFLAGLPLDDCAVVAESATII